MLWGVGGQAVPMLQVFLLSRIKWFLDPLLQRLFFFFIPFTSSLPQDLDFHLRILHKTDRETVLLLRFYQRPINGLFFIQIGQFLARYRDRDKG